MIYKCNVCGKGFPRLEFLLHKTGVCMIPDENEDEVSEVDDSDADPWYSPLSSDSSTSDTSQRSSPLTVEQLNMAKEVETLLTNVEPSFLEDVPPSPGSALQDVPPSPGPALQDVPPSPGPALQDAPPSPEPSLQDVPPSPGPALQDVPPSPGPALQDVTSPSEVPATTSSTPNVGVYKSIKLNNKRVWNKKDFCFFCEKLVKNNFTRHIIRNHIDELEVGRIIAHPKGSKMRRILFDKLKKKGSFLYNKECLRENSGDLIVAQRPSKEKSVTGYLPCKYCLGFFSANSLYRHVNKCQSKPADGTSKHARSCGSTLLIVTPNGFDNLKEKVFPTMRHDEITKAAQVDSLICEFGARMLQHHKENHMINVISQKMRELARLKLEMNQTELSNIISPDTYKAVVSSVQKLSGYDEKTGKFKVPSLAKKLGFSLKTCSEILECKGIMISNEKIVQKAKNFSTLLDKMWKFDVSKNATKTLETSKWNRPKMLPLAEDIKLIHNLLTTRENDLCNKLHSITYDSEIDWRELADVTLARIILLNRRRSGEAQRIKVSDYESINNQDAVCDVAELLTETEKTLCKSLTRFVIRGKGGRPVPVLLTSSMVKSVDMLISFRDKAFINPENPHLFAIPRTAQSCIRGSDVLRKYARLSGCKFPDTIKSTTLRKHVATMSQLLNITSNDIEGLATFLGHSTDVHKEYYRLPDNVAQMAKISKLLLALESGKLKELKGLNFDNINVSDVSEDEDETPQSKTNDCTNFYKSPNAEIETLDTQPIPAERTTSVKSRKQRTSSVKRPWSDKEKDALVKHFKKNMIEKRVPKKEECVKVKDKEPCLEKRSWSHIKDAVRNMFGKL